MSFKMGIPSLKTLSKQLKKLATWEGVLGRTDMSDIELADALGVSNMSVAEFKAYYDQWAELANIQQKVAKKAAQRQNLTNAHFKKALKLQKQYLDSLAKEQL